MKRIFVSGPYRSATENGVFENIVYARDVAMQLVKAGHAPFTPHLNTAFMGGIAPDVSFLDICFKWLEVSDGILMIYGWERSSGACGEKAFAEEHGIPVYYLKRGELPEELL